jgi:hypothetical protein
MRPASQRSNSTLKEELKILDQPRVLHGRRAPILAQLAAMALLLKGVFSFILRVTHHFRKLYRTTEPAVRERLRAPFIASSIEHIIPSA